jgi:hypothetical protein
MTTTAPSTALATIQPAFTDPGRLVVGRGQDEHVGGGQPGSVQMVSVAARPSVPGMRMSITHDVGGKGPGELGRLAAVGGTLGFAPPLAAASYRAGSSIAWASWRREVTPSFRNTLRRW